MKRIVFFLLSIIGLSQSFAQSVSQVLEEAIVIEKDDHIFLQYNPLNNTWEYDLEPKNGGISTNSLKDSTVFIAKGDVSVYLLPVNPLNFSHSSEIALIIDPINETATESLGSIIEGLKDVSTPFHSSLRTTTGACTGNIDSIQSKINQVAKHLEDNKLNARVKIFNSMKSLNFSSKKTTNEEITEIKKKIDELKEYYSSVNETIISIDEEIKNISCPDPAIGLSLRYALKEMTGSLKLLKNQQEEKLVPLNNFYNLILKGYNTYDKPEQPDFDWTYKLGSITLSQEKNTVYTIILKKQGYHLNDESEIVETPPVEVLRQKIIIRKFQRFIPEVSVGTAFTFFNYNSYGTVVDSAGQHYVGSPVEKNIRNLNITTMINFNYYIPNSVLHPFYQIGFGINEGIPTLLSGLGFRSAFGINKLSLSAGIAATWLEELSNLEVGDAVSGTTEIEEDLNYNFSWPPKPYVGLQYNF